tara:strand:+ start:565 stop:2373 length:1809 start_codon:yes stop_codon:yes gene_type:complete
MANQGINYNARNFVEVRSELINFVKQYYPDLFSDFNDASVGQMLLELNAAVADMLSYNTDRTFQETQIDYAQERASILAMGRTLGLNVPGVRPSMCLVDFTVIVPPKGDSFDINYAPMLKYGSQVEGAGQIFQVDEDVNFASPLSSGGVPNRLVLPNKDSNGVIVSYSIVKREAVINGRSKVLKRNVRPEDIKPFMEIILPETNVTSIEQVKLVDGLDAVEPSLSDFLKFENSFYEVDSLAESQVFMEDKNRQSDNGAIIPGKWVSVDKRFVKDYTDKGFCRLTFGSGTPNAQPLVDYINNNSLSQIDNVLNNKSLGELPKANSTLFIRYNVGGGESSNVGPNVLQNKGVIYMITQGSSAANNEVVELSLKCTNPTPAIGGADTPSIDELRHLIKYNFASQNRAVTVRDYYTLITKMSSKFGVPYKSAIAETQNKIEVSTLSLDSNRKLTAISTDTLNDNMSRYLANYRMINDYITVTSGKIINISMEVYCYIDKNFNKSLVISQMINTVSTYLSVTTQTMGQNIYLSDLTRELNNIDGVLNIVEFKVYNKIGGKYSLNITPQELDPTTNEISIKESLTLFGNFNTMYEIKYPTTDIQVFAK